jgi:glycosyltransferase involved in cell wall biosynthesis
MPHYIVESAWLEHGAFASWLVEHLSPKVFVELGTHRGYSYFAFCEAIRNQSTGTACYAVDTWLGDEHAGAYDGSVFADVSAKNARYYQFSTLVRNTFSAAVEYFGDKTIDLLHIDGRHFYDDVVEDFTTWSPKLTDDAIVLFHDTNVRERNFGVWKFFEELKGRYPSFEFVHCHGLGLIAMGAIPAGLDVLFRKDFGTTHDIRELYQALGHRISLQWQLNIATDKIVEQQGLLDTARHDATEKLLEQQGLLDDARREISALDVQKKALERDNQVLYDRVRDQAANLERVRDRVTQLETSTSWWVTKPLRFASRKSAALARRAFRSKSLARRLAVKVLRFIAPHYIAYRRIRQSNAFDVEFYRSQVPELTIDPLWHYVTKGYKKDVWPHPLFDPTWYRRKYLTGSPKNTNPFLHFLQQDIRNARRPNAYLDPFWYITENPGAGSTPSGVLQHSMRFDFDPSPEFSASEYLAHNKDVADLSSHSLVHFLHYGRDEGRKAIPSVIPSEEVFRAKIACIKFSVPSREVALFVTHSPDGKIKPHVQHYVEQLKKQGIDVWLLIAADRPFEDDEQWVTTVPKAVFIRENKGFDFAAWAHVLRLERALYGCDIVYLLNDSLFGPTNEDDFGKLIMRVRTSAADIVGLTDNHERGWHIQSYFLAIKQSALRSFAFQKFIISIRSFDDKDDVINNYEVKFVPKMQAKGMKVEALFKAMSIHNPTVYHWRELLAAGFPFLKVMTARDDIPNVDKSGWRGALSERGYDISLADRCLAKLQDSKKLQQNASSNELLRDSHSGIERTGKRHVTLIGPWNFANGLGFASRGYSAALMHTSLSYNLEPVRKPFHIHARIAPTISRTDFIDVSDVVLIHLNPEGWGHLLTPEQNEVIGRARKRIGLFVWESEQLPPEFSDAARELDAIWVPSSYCADVFKNSIGIPVEVVPYPLEASACAAPKLQQSAVRRSIGLDESRKVILYTFDASSYIIRKNPAALVRAFNASGLADEGWDLVLKTKHLSLMEPDIKEFIDICRASKGVAVINRPMSSREIGALLDTCEIYASSHCSEGFGLTIAEALGKGKVVVATNYGGSTDFLDETTGFPVRYEKFKLDKDYGAYRRGTTWGLVDEGHLTECLIKAATLSDESRKRFAQKARERFINQLSPNAVGARMEQILAEFL